MKTISYFLPLLLLISLLSISPNSYAGGPWLLKKKTGFLQFQAIPSAYRYSRLLNGNLRETTPINREVWNADYNFYGEFGLSDKLDITLNVPFKTVSTGPATDSLYFPTLLPEGSLVGISNTIVGLKYGILDDDLKLALSVQAGLNTASTDLEKGLATGYQANSLGLIAHVGGSINEKSYAFF